jgi:Fe2+ or Zn2+ uptake regulation protein
MCGAVAHFHDEEIGAIGERVEAASGYTLEDRELTFRGQCLGCANS